MTQYKQYEYRDRTYILPAVEDGDVARVAVEWQPGDIQDGNPPVPVVVTRKNGQRVYVQWNVERGAYAPEFAQWHDPAVWQALTVR